MEVEPGPGRRKRLAVVSKGQTTALEYLFNVFLPIHNSEVTAHLFYGISHYVPKSTQLKIIKKPRTRFSQVFGLWILKPCLFLQLSCIFVLPALR